MPIKKNILIAVLRCKCPNCREGALFVQKNLLPFRNFLIINKQCVTCGQKLQGEINNGPGINFALTTLLFFLNLAWYYPLFGFNSQDDSIYYFIGSSTLVVCLAQPYLMRLSRSLYLFLLLAIKG